MRVDVSYLSLFISLITLTSSTVAKEKDGDDGSRAAVQARAVTEIGLSILSPLSLRAGIDGDISKKEKEGVNKNVLATLTITADVRPTLLAMPQPPNSDILGLIGNINLNNLIGSTSSTFLNDNDFQVAVLNSTNTIRQQHNATALVWNTTLVSYAQNWSERCRRKKSVSIPNNLRPQSRTYVNH
jgi:hypothetical protein